MPLMVKEIEVQGNKQKFYVVQKLANIIQLTKWQKKEKKQILRL